MKKILLSLSLVFGLITTSNADAADYYTTRLRMERELNYICTTSIGASYNSIAYLECRDFYDRRFYEYGLDWDYLTAAQITEFLVRTNPYIRMCQNRGLISTLLWGCIRDYEDDYYRDWKHHHPHFKPKREFRPHFKGKHHRPDVKPHKPEPPHRPDVKPHKPKPPHRPDVKPHKPEPPHRPDVKPHKPEPAHRPDVKPHKPEPAHRPATKVDVSRKGEMPNKKAERKMENKPPQNGNNARPERTGKGGPQPGNKPDKKSKR